MSFPIFSYRMCGFSVGLCSFSLADMIAMVVSPHDVPGTEAEYSQTSLYLAWSFLGEDILSPNATRENG